MMSIFTVHSILTILTVVQEGINRDWLWITKTARRGRGCRPEKGVVFNIHLQFILNSFICKSFSIHSFAIHSQFTTHYGYVIKPHWNLIESKSIGKFAWCASTLNSIECFPLSRISRQIKLANPNTPSAVRRTRLGHRDWKFLNFILSRHNWAGRWIFCSKL